MMPALPELPLQPDSPQLIIINIIVSIMPARHRDRDSGSRLKLSTIRPSACPRRAGMSVHDALESLDSISRNNQQESDEGKALRELREIRVAATPDWNADQVQLNFFFIRGDARSSVLDQTWDHWLTKWLGLLPRSGRYVSIEGLVLTLSEMQADEYIASDQLDLDHLSPTSSSE
jgi:hypothetical protein